MIRLHQVHHPLIHRTALAGVDLAQAGLALLHLPLAVHLFQLEVDDAEVVAPVAGHHGGDAARVPAWLSTSGRSGKSRGSSCGRGPASGHPPLSPWPDARRSSPSWPHVAAGIDAGVSHHHHDVGALGAARAHSDWRSRPCRPPPPCPPDDACPTAAPGAGSDPGCHLDALALALVIGHLALQQQIGGELVAAPVNLPLASRLKAPPRTRWRSHRGSRLPPAPCRGSPGRS